MPEFQLRRLYQTILTYTSINSEELGKYISQAEAARIVGTSKQTMAYRVRRGYFTTKVVAGLVLVLRSEAESIAARHKGRLPKKELKKKKPPTKSADGTLEHDSGKHISQAEAARIRGVSEQAIADLIRRGRLTTVKVAGRTLVLRSEIESFVARPKGRPPKRSTSKKASKRIKPKK
jgi:DNA-binding XRE family transcriptional regulator